MSDPLDYAGADCIDGWCRINGCHGCAVVHVVTAKRPLRKRRRVAARLAEVQRRTTTTTAEFAVAK